MIHHGWGAAGEDRGRDPRDIETPGKWETAPRTLGGEVSPVEASSFEEIEQRFESEVQKYLRGKRQ
jgi:hypothetical protein